MSHLTTIKTWLKAHWQPLAIAAGAIAVAAALGVTWWATHRAPAVAKRQPTYTINTGLIGEYAGLIYIAQHEGYFADNGLRVVAKQYASGPASLKDLLQGNIDIAVSGDFAGVINSFTNRNLRILATISKSQAFYIVARKDHGVAQIQDLKGKHIGLTRSTVGEFYLGQFLAINGIDAKAITTVDMPQANLVSALVAGQIDAAVVFEPNAYQAASALGDKAIRWSVQGGQNIYSLLFGTDKLVSQQPQVVARYLQSLLEAEQFIKTHNSQAKAIIAQQLQYTPAYINYIWPQIQFNLSLDEELLLNMSDEAHWAIQNHLTTASVAPDYLGLFYFDGLQKADPSAITVIR